MSSRQADLRERKPACATLRGSSPKAGWKLERVITDPRRMLRTRRRPLPPHLDEPALLRRRQDRSEHEGEVLAEADFMFIATDTHTSRLVANAASHRFLVPLIQIGAKVDFDKHNLIGQIYVAVRPVFPGSGCLYCNGLIDSNELQIERLSPSERKAQNYVGASDVIDPSVITLNGISASHATTTMMLTAPRADGEALAHRLYLPATGEAFAVKTHRDPACPFCSQAFGLGGTAADLPTRLSLTEVEGGAAGSRGLHHRILAYVRRLGRQGTST